jgi:hypothetical protein
VAPGTRRALRCLQTEGFPVQVNFFRRFPLFFHSDSQFFVIIMTTLPLNKIEIAIDDQERKVLNTCSTDGSANFVPDLSVKPERGIAPRSGLGAQIE